MSEAKHNARMLVTVLAMVSIAALVLFFLARAMRLNHEATEINRDGISCVLEQLNAHRMNSFTADQQEAKAHSLSLDTPAPAAQPLPAQLLKACDRFLEAPR